MKWYHHLILLPFPTTVGVDVCDGIVTECHMKFAFGKVWIIKYNTRLL
jgi:hypothetical protein